MPYLPSCGPEFQQRVKDMARKLGTTDQILAWRILMLDIEAPRARAIAMGAKDNNPDPFRVIDIEQFCAWWKKYAVQSGSDRETDQKRAADHRNNYGMKGVAAHSAPLRK